MKKKKKNAINNNKNSITNFDCLERQTSGERLKRMKHGEKPKQVKGLVYK